MRKKFFSDTSNQNKKNRKPTYSFKIEAPPLKARKFKAFEHDIYAMVRRIHWKINFNLNFPKTQGTFEIPLTYLFQSIKQQTSIQRKYPTILELDNRIERVVDYLARPFWAPVYLKLAGRFE